MTHTDIARTLLRDLEVHVKNDNFWRKPAKCWMNYAQFVRKHDPSWRHYDQLRMHSARRRKQDDTPIVCRKAD